METSGRQVLARCKEVKKVSAIACGSKGLGFRACKVQGRGVHPEASLGI